MAKENDAKAREEERKEDGIKVTEKEALDENLIDRGGLELRPTEYFRRQIYASFWFEKQSVAHAIDKLGDDNIMFETDFPHPTCLYPEVRGHVEASLGDLSETTQRKILYVTASRVYNLPVDA